MTQNPNRLTEIFGEPIHTYSRAQAIEDGLLVPASEELARNAGIAVPVALTAQAWADCVAWNEADNRRKNTFQDETGRLWDVLFMTGRYIRAAARNTDHIEVKLYRVPRNGRTYAAQFVRLIAQAGPDDSGQMVITIRCAHEDD
ncbi:DUF6573 family protein [Streptomyces sp. NPDC056987]|uniref:DUF6573 family protein n=1 Tax=Streptomyces sp. NPDC056987 TaxID=3345988 RepID=UPI00362C67DE